jgi:hypothetical protein
LGGLAPIHGATFSGVERIGAFAPKPAGARRRVGDMT